MVALGQTNPSIENYVLQTQYQVPVTTDLPNTAINNDKKIENIVYYDGLGRPKQSVAIRAGGNREDLVIPILYDPLGRQPKEFLPLPLIENNGVFNSNTTVGGEPGVTKNLEDYYQTKFSNDLPQGFIPGVILNPYSEKRFENSPLNRVMEQAAPGEDWRLLPTLDVDHTIKFDYQTNAAEDYVIRFTVSFTNDDPSQPNLEDQQGYYPPNHLYKTVTKDENWEPRQTNVKNHTTEEFRDKLGRVVLKRTFDNGWLDTYYVYDDFGNLTYVIPPLVDKNNNDVSPDELNKLCYQYKYDYRNRLVWKKIPGKDYETILYNVLNRPVLTQDANMREDNPNKYLFTKYDGLGRVAYTGFYTASISKQSIEDSLQSKTPASISEIQKTTAQGPIQIGDTQVYYTNSSFPYDNLQVLTINYYDQYVDYTVPGNNGLLLPIIIYDQKTTENISVGTTTKGLPTVGKVRILGTNEWTTSLTAYDSRGRAIYSDSYNEYLDSRDILHSNLDLITGRPIETFTVHKKGTGPAINIFDYFTYDHMGRLLSQKQKIDNSPLQLIAENHYDELGQLLRKDVGGETQANGYTDIANIAVTYDGIMNKNNGTNAWDAWISTKGKVTGNGGVGFTVDVGNVYAKIGLRGTITGDTNFTYGIYIEDLDGNNDGQKDVKVIVDGGVSGIKTGYQAGDSFTVVRSGTNIYFKKNGATFYGPITANTQSLVGKAVIYSSGAQISDFGIFGDNIDKKLQNVDYLYNIRGWLTDINYVGTYTEGLIGLDNDLFNFRINYNRVEGNATNAPLYNGNIAQTLWKTKSADKNVRGYSYSYDPLNRIKGAESYKGASLNTMGLNTEYTVNGISYDQNGNILTLARKGADDNTVPSFGQWDDLTYIYDGGNRLMKVVDNSTSGSHKGFGFKDGINGGADYRYDYNGNMNLDNNKDITSITYNHLNLPTEIVFGTAQNNKIEYVYDATGTKLSKKVQELVGNALQFSNTQYAGGIVYADMGLGVGNMKLQFISQLEGYVKPVSGTSESVEGFDKDIGGTTNSTYSYVFQYKDHLGNVRLSYSDSNLDGSINPTSEIIEESNYYPFGLKQKGYNTTISPSGNTLAQQWKYNGVELNESLGTNLYEMDFRQYDPTIGRFNSIDPLNHFSMSTYTAFDNNPVFWADPSGADSQDIWGRNTHDRNGVYIPPWERKSNDDSGLATKNDETKTITVTSNLVLYGNEASNVDAQAIASEIQNSYNGANGTILYNNVEYSVIFSISVSVVSEEEAKKIASANTDISTNFIRIENKSTSVNRSFMEVGGNAGFWLVSDGLGNSTTAPHEIGHGYGLEHSNSDQRGVGIPDIMAARGTLVDSKYQWNPQANAGDYGGTINPKYRQVLQSNINLIFKNINFSNGKANIGKLTNTIYDENGNPQ